MTCKALPTVKKKFVTPLPRSHRIVNRALGNPFALNDLLPSAQQSFDHYLQSFPETQCFPFQFQQGENFQPTNREILVCGLRWASQGSTQSSCLIAVSPL